MKIPIILNGERTIIDANVDEPLLITLRKQKLYSVKCGCRKGLCGECTVLVNDTAVPSCLVPLGIARECEIVTLEYFRNTPYYQDIMAGFAKAGVSMCGYCNSAKIFSAYMILKNYPRPNAKQIYSGIKGLAPCCTDNMTLANGILYAAEARRAREKKELGAGA